MTLSFVQLGCFLRFLLVSWVVSMHIEDLSRYLAHVPNYERLGKGKMNKKQKWSPTKAEKTQKAVKTILFFSP